MGKQKKKSGKHAMQKVKSKKTSKEMNPFEMRINRQHHDILGRKVNKDKGMPGVSRSKALKKRQETLLQEYRFRNKSNTFTDRRIGESDPLMAPDEKAVARFTLERKKKGNKYNLSDDTEELTHLGKSLGDIEKYDFPLSDSDDDEKLMDKDFIKKVHFGGLLTKKYADKDEAEKSQKELIDEMIADSKKRKYERKAEKEANLDLTDKLDNDWKELQKLMFSNKQKQDESVVTMQSDYDVKVQELKYESRGQATDRLKTEEEIAQEEKEKLDKLELQRQNRMLGITEEDTKAAQSKHFSADALDDGFQLDEEDEDDNEEYNKKSKKGISDVQNVTSEEDDSNNEEGEDESGEENSDDESDEDSYDDILSENDEVDDQSPVKPSKDTIKISKKKSAIDAINVPPVEENELLKAASDLPFVFDAPDSIDEFLEMIHNRNMTEKKIIIERIMKCNHPSLANGNKEKLEKFFVILLQFVHDICSEVDSEIEILDILIPHLYALVQMSSHSTCESMLGVLKEKREEFLVSVRSKNEKHLPDLSTLIYFQLVSIFYSVSDFRHPIVTPSMIFMSEILMKCTANSPLDIIRGLFLSSIYLEYVSFSKRVVPEVLNFINKVLGSPLLNVEMTNKKTNVKSKINLSLLKDSETTEKLFPTLVTTVIGSYIDILSKFADLYRRMASYKELFDPTVKICSSLSDKLNENSLRDKIETLVSKLKDIPERTLLTQEKKKPLGIKMYEPKIQEVFDGRKQRHGSQKKLEQQKLNYKLKRETKGATREIRRDNQFIAREKLNEQMDRDAERKRKLNLLYQDLAQQEGDFKRMKKKK